MPLPGKAGAKRLFAGLKPFAIADPGFVPIVEKVTDAEGRPVLKEDGTPETRERWGEAKVYLRPLLDVEVDKADRLAGEFTRRYLTGGFVHPTTEEWSEHPMPLLVDGLKVELEETHVVAMHRYEAMQAPMAGDSKPSDYSLVTVADMVEATVKYDTFWRGLQLAAGQVWREGQTGKAWAAEAASTPQENG